MSVLGAAGRSFVGKRTAKGLVAGGLLFAPQRLKCVNCGTTLKSGSGSGPSRFSIPASQVAKPETRTKHGYVRRADGVVVVPEETKRLFDAWKDARADIAGLTLEELVQRIGFEADDLPAAFHVAGYLRSWSRPGYTISVLFGREDGRAIRIPQGVPFEELG